MNSQPQNESRWILGFDAGCGSCARLADQLVEIAGGRLTAKSLRSTAVQQWRAQALGPDAPWAPTLFKVDGSTVQAWTGHGLVVQLGRLVGPRNLWLIANSISDLMSSTAVPASPGRRDVLRKGLVGTATAFALLSGGNRKLPSIALAQESTSSAAANSYRNPYSVEQLTPRVANGLEQKADNDTHFNILRDYFRLETGRNWRQQGRESTRFLKNGQRVRDAFWITYKNPGEAEWAHVMFRREANGREIAEAYLWRGRNRRFTDRFHVQNGNLHRDNHGRIDAQASAQSEPEPNDLVCGFNDWSCAGVVYGGCTVVTANTVVFCGISVFTVCDPVDTVVSACADHHSEWDSGCKEWSGPECQ